MSYLQVIKGNKIGDKEIKEAIEIDDIVYPEGYRGTMEICKRWQNKNPDIYIFLKDLNIDKVVGCINLMPLSDEYFDLVENGRITDIEIPSSEIRTYDEPGLYKMCLISITLLEKYRDSEAIKLLYGAILDKLIELSEKGIYCKELLADVISPDGEKFCKSLGMKPVRVSEHKSLICKVKFFPFLFNVIDEKGDKLRENYKTYQM